MSSIIPSQVSDANSLLGYFDDEIINVPQAQDSTVYAGQTSSTKNSA